MAKHQRETISILKFWGFIGIHFVPFLAIFTGTFSFDWALALSLYLIRMFFITAGYHRYFSHRTFKTSRVFQFLLAFFAQTSMQKGALWWAANHRIHHKKSDTLEDPHSAKLFGFWYAHVGWIVGKNYKETRYDLIKDLAKFPELVWLNKFHWVPAASLMAFTLFLGNMVNGSGILDFQAGVSTLLIGFFLSTVVLYHGTFTINSLMHEIGKRRYNTDDDSRNSIVLALITLGEGWHNNHHYYQSTARQGFFWWEIDITYYVIRILGFFRIVWDIREVPKHVLEGNRIKEAA